MITYKINEEKNGVELYFNSCPALETRENLKSNGWRWSRFGGCWYNQHTEENLKFAVALANGEQITAPEVVQPKKTDYSALIKEYALRDWPENQHMREYIEKSTFAAVRLENGDLLAFDKPHIKTRFCFHDEGPDYELYKDLHSNQEKMRKYFFSENLESIEAQIEQTKKDDQFYLGFVHNKRGIAYFAPRRYRELTYLSNIEKGLKTHELEPNWTQATDTERTEILTVLQSIKTDLEKRLQIWWKKYGADRLHTWTYWADA